jgi:glycopeptide antibiotics resistance protein
MKSLSKILLVIYSAFLAWLVLLKTSINIPEVLSYGQRSINLVPFAGAAKGEMLENFIFFIPLGLLLSAALKQHTFGRKLAFIFGFSVTAEVIQFILAIGSTDITDVITNVLGGLLGLGTYDLLRKYIHDEKLDRIIAIIIALILTALLCLRFFVFKVRY